MKLSFPRSIPCRFAAIVLASTQLVACGNVLDALPGAGAGGNKSTNLAPTLTGGIFSGVAKDSLIRNGVVKIYAWNGSKGDLLGSGKTDDKGIYSVQLTVRSQSVLLEVSGGSYIEEVTSKDISLNADQTLYAVQNYISGKPLTTAITYYTTLATGLAENLVRLGMKPADAIEEANTRLSTIIGLDALSVVPTDILAPGNFSLPELQYGFATAALSSLTERSSILNGDEPHKVFTSVAFIQTAYDDIRADGVLNGRGVNGEVAFGKIRLNAEIYRHQLALHILRIANNKNANRTGRSPMQMFDLAKRLNDSTDPIFGGDPVIPIDSDKPNISALASKEFPNLSSNSVVFGGLNLTAMVAAFPGAASAQLIVDDQVMGSASDPENPSVPLQTFSPPIAEGRHTLKFRVTDISGAVGESPVLDVIVSNQQTAIASVSIDGQFVGMQTMVAANIVDPALPQRIDYSVKPQGGTAFIPVATITPEVPAAMLQPTAVFDPAQQTLSDGDATFRVQTTNSAGFVFGRDVSFVIDREKPTVTTSFDLTPVLPPPSPTPDGGVGFPLIPVSPGRFYDRNLGTPCTPMSPAVLTDPCTLYARLPFAVVPQASDNRAIDRLSITVAGTDIGQPFVAQGIQTSASSAFTIDPINTRPDGEKILTVTVVDKAQNTAAVSQSIIFDTTPPSASSPQITQVADNDGSLVRAGNPTIVRGPVNISAQVDDPMGIASTQILINGSPVSAASARFTPGSDNTRATIELLRYDTSVLTDGANTVSVQATDRAGNSFVSTVNLDAENSPPVINLTALRYNRNGCFLDGSVVDPRFDSLVLIPDPATSAPGAGMQTIRSGGTGGNFSINLLSFGRLFPSGDNIRFGFFMLRATDEFGNTIIRNLNFLEQAPIGGDITPRMCTVQENSTPTQGGTILFRVNQQ